MRITWADGAVTSHSAGTVVRFPTRRPLKIEGRLYLLRRWCISLTYEAPALEPATADVRHARGVQDLARAARRGRRAHGRPSDRSCSRPPTRWIDQQCGRHFSLENEATKLYYPSNADYLDVVDLISITSLKLDTERRSHLCHHARRGRVRAAAVYGRRRPAERALPASQHLAEQLARLHPWRAGADRRRLRLRGRRQPCRARSISPCLMLSSRWWKRHEAPVGTAIVPDMGSFAHLDATTPISSAARHL